MGDYLAMGEVFFHELDKRYQKLDRNKDWLVRLKKQIPWVEFRPLFELIRHIPRKSNTVLQPSYAVLMFKLIVLQKLFNLSDGDSGFNNHTISNKR